MKKKNISILLNSIVIILEIIGLIIIYKISHKLNIEYYTIDSNILVLASSILYLIYTLRNKKLPNWIKQLKYISAIGVAITFLVVIFILIPMSKFNFYGLLIKDSMLIHHVLL